MSTMELKNKLKEKIDRAKSQEEVIARILKGEDDIMNQRVLSISEAKLKVKSRMQG